MNTIVTLSVVGIVAMMSEVFKFKKLLYAIVIVGLLTALGLSINDWNDYGSYFHNMVLIDNYAISFSFVMIGICLLWFFMSKSYFTSESSAAEHYSLIIFALTGAVIMVSFADLSMLFIGLEILSISLYILAGSDKSNTRSNESALKYFMMGAFATGFLLFGIALIYGVTGAFNLKQIAVFVQSNVDTLPVMFYAGVLLMLIGLAFKVSAAPFHFWAPDVYDGAPTVVTAFMATVVKTAAFAAFYRLFITCFSSIYEFWVPVIAILSAITMLVGNISAVYQTSLKRMLAFSSVANAGYMLMALAAPSIASKSALLFYALAYSLSSIGVFAVLHNVYKTTGNEGIKAVKGLAKTNPFAAIMVTICMLSMAGIPPVAGFFGKYYVFVTALNSDLTWLVLVAVLSSLIGVYYYFKVIIALFQEPELENTAYYEKSSDLAVLYIAGILTLLLGLAPQFVAGLL